MRFAAHCNRPVAYLSSPYGLSLLPSHHTSTTCLSAPRYAYRLSDGLGFEVRQLHERVLESETIVVPAGAVEYCM